MFFSFSDPIVLLKQLTVKSTDSPSKPCQEQLHYEKLAALARKGNELASSQDPHTCCFCQRVFSKRSVVKKHLDFVHCRPNKIFCDLCPKFFYTKNAISKHMKGHSSKRFACSKCDYKSDFKNLFNQHMNTHAPKVACLICNKPVSAMADHMKSHKPKVSCTVCQKLVHQVSIERHMKIHSVHPRKCKICEDILDNEEDLKR